MPTPFDYDRDPDRFRRASRLTRRHLTGTPSLYAHLAELLAEADPRRILDIGCGEGALRAALPAALKARLVGLDASVTMLAGHPPPVVQADAAALPVVTGGVDAAVASTSSTTWPTRPGRSPRPTGPWPPAGSSWPPRPAATTPRSWPPSGGRRRPASTPRTGPGWLPRSSPGSRWSAGTRR